MLYEIAKIGIQVGVFIVASVGIFLLSIPLHELNHLVIFKLAFGKRGKIRKVNFLKIYTNFRQGAFGVQGSLIADTNPNPENETRDETRDEVEEPPVKVKVRPGESVKTSTKRLIFFLTSSGGYGTSIILGVVSAFLLSKADALPWFLSPLGFAFLLVALFHLIYGIREGISAVNNIVVEEEE